jgi:hypothetical protein
MVATVGVPFAFMSSASVWIPSPFMSRNMYCADAGVARHAPSSAVANTSRIKASWIPSLVTDPQGDGPVVVLQWALNSADAGRCSAGGSAPAGGRHGIFRAVALSYLKFNESREPRGWELHRGARCCKKSVDDL